MAIACMPRLIARWLPWSVSRPVVGLKPNRPHAAAGWRMLPPRSLPNPNGEPPAATQRCLTTGRSAGAPIGVARVERATEHGVVALVHQHRLRHVRLAEYDGAGRPQPCDQRGESISAGPFAYPGMPSVISLPRTAKQSLIDTGTPCSGPSGMPVAVTESAPAASALSLVEPRLRERVDARGSPPRCGRCGPPPPRRSSPRRPRPRRRAHSRSAR